MRFSTKIFYAIFLTTIATCLLSSIIIYSILKKNIESEYYARYQSIGETITIMFNQIENEIDSINANAVRALYDIEQEKGLPSNQALNKLAKDLGIKAFYVTNQDGRFIRSTDIPLSTQTNSLFSYCQDYKHLVSGDAKLYKTPIIPASPHNIPMKLTMIPNHNRKLILESGMELAYIERVLQQMIQNDDNIKALGFYTPTGFELGSISRSDGYHQNRKSIFLNADALLPHQKIKNEKAIFNIRIPSDEANCCECLHKKLSGANGKYYYILRIEVSLDPLLQKINILRIEILSTLLLAFILSLIFSRILAKKLVSRIEKINKTASEIIRSGDLNLRVNIKEKSDEISNLAATFNKMIQSLKKSQSQLIETEKMREIAKLSAQLAHDIRSPLAVMEITLNTIVKNIPTAQYATLREAIQSMRDIANNLLKRYRESNKLVNTDSSTTNLLKSVPDDTNIPRPVLLSSLIELVISQKHKEWQNNPCELSLTIMPNAKFAWIYASPHDIKRILSNLLNNSYEALEKNRKITLRLTLNNQALQLQILDKGQGIPENKINDVLMGASLKHSGYGLGLSSAKQYLENLGGKLILSSVYKQGTEVTLFFPLEQKPTWFPETIQLFPYVPVIVLDDDACIHNLWRDRLQAISIQSQHFMQSDDVIAWYQKKPELREQAIFLMDYELRNDTYNGLTLLELFNPKTRGYLITSHAEEIAIQQRCKQLGVWLIPKNLAGEIPLQLVG